MFSMSNFFELWSCSCLRSKSLQRRGYEIEITLVKILRIPLEVKHSFIWKSDGLDMFYVMDFTLQRLLAKTGIYQSRTKGRKRYNVLRGFHVCI